MNFSQLGFGGFGLKILGLFLGLIFMGCAWYFYKKIQSRKLSVDFFVHHFWKWLLGGLLVGRIFALGLNPDIFSEYGVLGFLAFWEGRVSGFGFLLGALAVAFWDLKKYKEPFYKWLDTAVLPFWVGVMAFDWATFITGEIYGYPTKLFWGVRYETFGVEILSPVHPITLYAFLIHLWVYFWLKRREKVFEKVPGKLAIFAGGFYFVIDFWTHIFRADQAIYVLGLLRVEQIFDLLALGGLAFVYIKYFRK